MKITLSEAQAGHHDFPVGTVVEVRLKADPDGVWTDRIDCEHGESGLLTLESDQIKDLISFAPGLTRVVSRAGEGRSQLLWHWIKSGGRERKTCTSLTRKAPTVVPRKTRPCGRWSTTTPTRRSTA